MRTRERYLSVATDYISHGVPVFVAEPNYDPEPEFWYPKGWQESQVDTSVLRAWFPTSAICAVTGVKFDVIDVDPRNGGDKSLALLREANVLPPVKGSVSTPGGGQHLYVPPSGLRKITDLWPGIDYQAGDKYGVGRGFVFVPGTYRRKYGYKGYEPIEPIDWEGLASPTDEDRERQRRWLQTVFDRHKTHKGTYRVSTDPNYSGGRLTDEQTSFLAREFYRWLVWLKQAIPGNRNVRLYKVARVAGGLISGSGLDEDVATERLLTIALDLGLTDKEAKDTIKSGVNSGKYQKICLFG
ncbi:bifunctional DNA primase/polymerase-like protein [Prauserella shujinwangii]|uniref:Bifunctional DNA primase/polymerase-like protein n=1 Tax=Prauserella shujinwangii TaxID=1453103 RepID=A0A2T0LSV3_9PSEU|nr:bifunctional DNA primase/polymerase-like protein [Prauserella shujinwangii]